MNARGVTGIVTPLPDLPPPRGQHLQCEAKGFTARVGYRIPVARSEGHEAQWFSNLMAFRPARVPMTGNGFSWHGEAVAGMNDGVRMAPQDFLPQAGQTALRRGRDMRYRLDHAYTDDGADAILTIFEQVAQQYVCALSAGLLRI